jgi:hypothetical protein
MLHQILTKVVRNMTHMMNTNNLEIEKANFQQKGFLESVIAFQSQVWKSLNDIKELNQKVVIQSEQDFKATFDTLSAELARTTSHLKVSLDQVQSRIEKASFDLGDLDNLISRSVQDILEGNAKFAFEHSSTLENSQSLALELKESLEKVQSLQLSTLSASFEQLNSGLQATKALAEISHDREKSLASKLEHWNMWMSQMETSATSLTAFRDQQEAQQIKSFAYMERHLSEAESILNKIAITADSLHRTVEETSVKLKPLSALSIHIDSVMRWCAGLLLLICLLLSHASFSRVIVPAGESSDVSMNFRFSCL